MSAPALIRGYEVVIGLETHAQLSTASKIFSGASTQFGAAPNTQACAVDLALPGTLPVMNKGAVERAIQFGLAVHAKVAPLSIFARKNYFYPDLPKGYQISQYEIPVVQGGKVEFVLNGQKKTVRLTRAHLEEDAGKSLHEDYQGQTGIDLNRAGTPLLEIVSEPDMRSSAEAVEYAKALHTLVVWLGICDGNMQEGSFRCDANVSVRKPGAPFGTRREIKNLNSFRFLQQAVDFEVQWQIDRVEDGLPIEQATVLFNPDTGETRAMRSKEDAADYRYFPDPDLPPLVISSDHRAPPRRGGRDDRHAAGDLSRHRLDHAGRLLLQPRRAARQAPCRRNARGGQHCARGRFRALHGRGHRPEARLDGRAGARRSLRRPRQNPALASLCRPAAGPPRPGRQRRTPRLIHAGLRCAEATPSGRGSRRR